MSGTAGHIADHIALKRRESRSTDWHR